MYICMFNMYVAKCTRMLLWAHGSMGHAFVGPYVKPGSQYDAGAMSITSILSVTEKIFFH